MTHTRILLCGILLFCITALNAQTEKGKFLIGASTNLQHSDLESDEFKEQYTTIESLVGYFVADNIAIGIQVPYYIIKSEYSKNETFEFIPFGRYYFMDEEVRPYLHAGIGFGSNNGRQSHPSGTTYDNEHSIFNYQLGGGIAYYITEIIALDIYVGYYHGRINMDDDRHRTSKRFNLKVGLSISL